MLFSYTHKIKYHINKLKEISAQSLILRDKTAPPPIPLFVQ